MSRQPFTITLTDAQFVVISHFLPKKHFLKRQKGRKSKKLEQNYQQMDSNHEQSNQKQSEVAPFLLHSSFIQGEKMTSYELQACSLILTQIKKRKFSQQFRFPVDPILSGVPHYFQVIKQPMDLKTMKEKLDNDQYITFSQFYLDLQRISQNCIKFNHDYPFFIKKGQIFKAQTKKIVKKYYNICSEDQEEEEESKAITDNPKAITDNLKLVQKNQQEAFKATGSQDQSKKKHKKIKIDQKQKQKTTQKDKDIKDIDNKKYLKRQESYNSESKDNQQRQRQQQQSNQNYSLDKEAEQEYQRQNFQYYIKEPTHPSNQTQKQENILQFQPLKQYQQQQQILKKQPKQINSHKQTKVQDNPQQVKEVLKQVLQAQTQQQEDKLKSKKRKNTKKAAALYGEKQTQKIVQSNQKSYTFDQKVKIIQRVKKLSNQAKLMLFKSINFSKGQSLNFSQLPDQKLMQIQTQLCIAEKYKTVGQSQQRKDLQVPKNENETIHEDPQN